MTFLTKDYLTYYFTMNLPLCSRSALTAAETGDSWNVLKYLNSWCYICISLYWLSLYISAIYPEKLVNKKQCKFDITLLCALGRFQVLVFKTKEREKRYPSNNLTSFFCVFSSKLVIKMAWRTPKNRQNVDRNFPQNRLSSVTRRGKASAQVEKNYYFQNSNLESIIMY